VNDDVTNLSLKRQTVQEAIMGAEYNWMIDSVPIRVAINVIAFAAWLTATVALLAWTGA
jgi:hypothetical protein